MKITDIKIVSQLRIGFGIILFLILILGGIFWQQTDRIAQQTTYLYEHPFSVRKALGELKADILLMRLEFRHLLLASDETSRQEVLMNSAVYQSNAQHQFDTLSTHYLGPKSNIDEARKAFLRWVAVQEEVRIFSKTGKIAEVLSLLEDGGNVGRERTELMNKIHVIEEFTANKADQFMVNSEKLKRSLELELALLVTGVLTLVFLIITFLIRNIIKPVSELTKVTRQFEEGKLNTRSSYTSANEFGVLSEAFNKLAKTIQEEFSFKDRSVQLNESMLKGLETNQFMKNILGPLMKLTNAQVGAIYLLDDQKTHFEHLESIGLDPSASNSYSALKFEGEFGAALARKKIMHITNIPAETSLSFGAVSGVLRPKEIITIPLVDRKEVIAMISLSSLQGFDAVAVRLMTDMQAPLTAWMNAMIANGKIQKLSENLKLQNVELETQKKELAAQANELSMQNKELETQKGQLVESNQLKTSFLSNMSHELRTPLNSVIALSGVLSRRLTAKIPEEEYSYLKVIERNGKQLLALINDILDLSRIEAGREEIKINTFRVHELILEVVELIAPQAKQKKIKLLYPENKNLPIIKSDFEKCRHILQNIVANAIKFTEKGEVLISSKADEESIHIEVKDTGIGIAKEFLPQIFDEFRQVDNSNARKHSGTGLGLSIAKKYTELLGGKISVESEPGIGSKFILTLPLTTGLIQSGEEIYPVHHTLEPFTIEESEEMPNKDKTILLVEDSEAVIIQMKDMLVSQGYDILVARNGNEALKQISCKIPDAMILDLMMPEVDGFEVLRTIREKEETSRLPVVILTAKYVSKEELAFLKHNHIHQLIQKGDINKNQLLSAVSRMMPPEIEPVNPSIEKPNRIPKPNSGVTPPVILVVEDNPDNLLTIKALLNNYAKVVEATDGIQGIEMALQYLPNLILMDIALPGKNGIDTLHAMREEKALEDIPVIAVSASAMKGDREHFLANGFNDYIPKPIDDKEFMLTVIKWTGEKD
jgi:signal transduction histidine kinase/DNA-binding response OmpR family regulator/HAMP domain-containing protein